MAEQPSISTSPADTERQALWPSVALVVAITAITWLAIALVFGVGQAGIAVFGGVGAGVSGLAVWALLWVAMWAAITLTVGGGLFAAFRAWLALYPRAGRAPAAAGGTIDRARREAVEEAEALLRRPRR